MLFAVLSCRNDVPAPQPAAQREPAAARQETPASATPAQVVKDFGKRLKDVSTTAPPDIAAKSIRSAYDGLVDRPLIETWANAPADAPGRPVSSPWPDRIEVTSVSDSKAEATVKGEIVEATSTGEARRVPVEIHLRKHDGKWLITSFQQVGEAAAKIHEYYAAIAARDYERAYRCWGSSGPPGQSLESFAAGFADTKSVEVKTGAPSRIEGAAGSQYVEVPVTIVAKTTTGQTQRFTGHYTLRRAMVDGAPPSDRQWHLYRAEIHETR